jgi:hypothetical protein
MRHLALFVLGLSMVLGPQHAPADRVAVAIQFRAVSEDETANGGEVTLDLGSGESRAASVWERECRVAGQAGSDVPADADQFWTFRASRAGERVRVRHRHVDGGRGATAPEEETVLSTDGRNPLVLSALSASTQCRYDRIAVTVSATTGR